ncbi:hypothetical protein MY1884_002098 [Beauveria asiatica]
MGKDSKKRESLELWQIEDFHFNQYYTRREHDGRVYYTRNISRDDLPESFWEVDWKQARQAREASERQATSSGYLARDARGRSDGRLISQEIANNPNIGLVTSSGYLAQDKRSGKKKHKESEESTKKKK